ncbi:MAG: thioredoxin-like domain-containing protein [Dokdonella sp.]|uniref:thioredoxin-like domain-containing protein n=1 Tax=Dokdonella sp. TaxID=2291710 RepID=UPI002B50B688|nr:thioredoxin-like domain-containing protein [Dokdonella sp.]HOX71394.1 thioredoxin-like domain-containing protein [Dokdonella sp.]HPG94542.1 thioredoxin-like domain-containing protein [Dokdonella sp.]HPN80371.1 thioredoxin-like domain-containing protein [Dokdonella sp.]
MDSRSPAPEFPAGLDWVNVSEAPMLSGLRGRVVLIWFWSYDNVHCWNLLPDLAYLESRYHDGLTVIGIHTPKYPHQHESGAVLKAVNRLQIRHPVANDKDFALWQHYAIDAWPSAVLIDAEGQIAAVVPGEGRRQDLVEQIGHLLDEAAERDLREYDAATPAARPEPRLPLLFPGKLLATDTLLYVADSGHHRVLECNHDGRILRQFGSADPGYWNGRNEECGFRDPQGLALRDDFLFVADRGNHAVRRIRLYGGDVETVLGTGEPGRLRPHAAIATETPIGNPTGLAVIADKLYVTSASQNQIWELDLGRGRVGMLAGTGKFELQDGLSLEASFAQPSGIAPSGLQLLVVDSASSAVRLVRLNDGRVTTLVGTGLYEFGDAPGTRETARLQNPLDIAMDPRGIIFVADSYNGKIKALSLKSGAVRALNLNYRLVEPGGLSIAAGALWIANTNVHEVVRIDLSSGVGKRVPIGE